ncbi:MAG: SH3 domain-containing protein [Chloroflexaceae bacterium]|nr:SH3 domain-containing protein [Chloroflexaceae bacterium]
MLLSRTTGQPLRPTFTEERADYVPESAIAEEPVPEPLAEPEPPPEPPPQEEPLPPGAYKARVTWDTGLSIRSAPDGESVAGIEYNGELIVLEESPDKRWQRIRVAGSGQEGWVKAGNIQKFSKIRFNFLVSQETIHLGELTGIFQDKHIVIIKDSWQRNQPIRAGKGACGLNINFGLLLYSLGFADDFSKRLPRLRDKSG